MTSKKIQLNGLANANDIIQIQRLYDYTQNVNRSHARVLRNGLYIVAAFTIQYENRN